MQMYKSAISDKNQFGWWTNFRNLSIIACRLSRGHKIIKIDRIMSFYNTINKSWRRWMIETVTSYAVLQIIWHDNEMIDENIKLDRAWYCYICLYIWMNLFFSFHWFFFGKKKTIIAILSFDNRKMHET